MKIQLEKYNEEMRQELENILSYWVKYTVDTDNGGFLGKVDNDNVADAKAPKGSVLNSRILWSFSAAYRLTQNVQYLQMAERAFKYICNYFIDKDYGGIYWTVDYKGEPLDSKKQVYALTFAVYGLSEYYLASKDDSAKRLAIELYRAIVEHSHDNINGGYIEALARDWKELADARLSAKDANEKKSMNTHLHVLEGFANLYRTWPDAALKHKIAELVNIFPDHIIHPHTNHLILFFDEQWNPKAKDISFGHDIEAAWLIQEAAEVIDDRGLIGKIKKRSVMVAEAAASGVDADGGLWYEYDAAKEHLIKQKHSWPQAEAMVGFFNVWQLTNDEKYLQRSLGSWEFIKDHIINKEAGEWYWGVEENYSVMQNQDKVGIWKCPYHSTRACMEIIRRTESTLSSQKFSLINSEISNQ